MQLKYKRSNRGTPKSLHLSPKTSNRNKNDSALISIVASDVIPECGWSRPHLDEINEINKAIKITP